MYNRMSFTMQSSSLSIGSNAMQWITNYNYIYSYTDRNGARMISRIWNCTHNRWMKWHLMWSSVHIFVDIIQRRKSWRNDLHIYTALAKAGQPQLTRLIWFPKLQYKKPPSTLKVILQLTLSNQTKNLFGRNGY